MSDDRDTCRPVEVDGQIIRVRGDAYEQGLFAEIVRAAKRRMEAGAKPAPVVRPQACDCGASQLAMVAHLDHCASRTRGTPLATPTPCPCTYSTGPVQHHPTCPEYDALL